MKLSSSTPLWLVLLATAGAEAAKRAADPNETIYLSDCQLKSVNPTQWSEIDWYRDGRHNSQNGQAPDDRTRVSTGLVKWEARDVCGSFSPSGMSVCATIMSDAGSHSTGQSAGRATRSDGAKFNCFKDNDKGLYVTDSYTCTKSYYCEVA